MRLKSKSTRRAASPRPQKKKHAFSRPEREGHLGFPWMSTILKPASRGTVELERFEVSKAAADWENMRSSWHPGGHLDRLDPGTFMRLRIDGQLVMSDTRMERATNLSVKHSANGRVLVAGLGLGMIVHAVAAKSNVESVTVIESNVDVIALVAPSLPRGAAVIHADIFEWMPPKGELFDTIYFDIWAEVSTDELQEMARLHRRFARRLNRANPNAWMGSWRREFLIDMRRRERSWR